MLLLISNIKREQLKAFFRYLYSNKKFMKTKLTYPTSKSLSLDKIRIIHYRMMFLLK